MTKSTTSTFQTRLKSHLRKTGNLIKERQGLIQEAYDVASTVGSTGEASNNFNKISQLLNGLWEKGSYAACHTIKAYLEDHSPMSITFKKEDDLKFTIKLVAKAADGTRPPYQVLEVAYNEWNKAKIEELMTADKLIGRIQSAIKASNDLAEDELVKFNKQLVTLVA